MKILGVKNTASEIRYAILEMDTNADITFANANSENKVSFPKGLESEEEKLRWIKNEIERIFSNNEPLDAVAIKQGENFPKRSYGNLKFSIFHDCLFSVCAVEKHIPLYSWYYNQIGTNSKSVLDLAESLVGRSSVNWNTRIADAIVVAHKAMKI